MSKPTIFFSHSSKDAQSLALLKERFVTATGGSIDIFLSSDGQSIQLGRNWVHRIEEALGAARLMFVFVTSNALRSNWIFFESGFAYSKGIRVIPVGFQGTDLAQLSPPLSLLQGFNINNEEGLNNIIAVVNDEFKHTHQGSFTNQDFADIAGSPSQRNGLWELHRLVRDISVTYTRASQNATPWNVQSEIGPSRQELKNVLEAEEIPFESSNDTFEIEGATVSIGYSNRQVTWKIKIDPGTAKKNLDIAERVGKALCGSGTKGMDIVCFFGPNVFYETRAHVVSGRLSGIASLGPRMLFVQGDIEFKVDRASHLIQGGYAPGSVFLIVGSKLRVPGLDEINALISLLFDREILHFTSELEE